ncbi:hypothetical protein AB0N06_19220 [Streptomyces sp. NPDC051020]|uniref:hypothetical protein n=1 Tax=Streptomyces sp. NPDC051020 TaxID=3155409 RepID=UPI003421603C
MKPLSRQVRPARSRPLGIDAPQRQDQGRRLLAQTLRGERREDAVRAEFHE